MQLPISSPPPQNQVLLPLFDSHNHIQLGDWISHHRRAVPGDDVDDHPSLPPIYNMDDIMNEIRMAVPECCGMALMSTHPRDFDIIHVLSHFSGTNDPLFPLDFTVVPSFGVHPWFVHELTEEDWESVTTETTMETMSFLSKYFLEHGRPRWMHRIETYISENPNAIIGEIGLDKFHYTTTTLPDCDDDNSKLNNNDKQHSMIQKVLTTPIEQQVLVFRLQMEMAIQYRLPVCVHCVHAFGPLLDALADIKQQYHCSNDHRKNNNTTFPIAKIYFHAYGGKLNTVQQILSLCEGKAPPTKSNATATTTTTKCYFGFAPCVNFRSPKTMDVIRAVGLSRLLLETDHEELSFVSSSLQAGVQYIAQALNVDTNTVMEQTTKNAMEFYNLTPPHDEE